MFSFNISPKQKKITQIKLVSKFHGNKKLKKLFNNIPITNEVNDKIIFCFLSFDILHIAKYNINIKNKLGKYHKALFEILNKLIFDDLVI